MPAAIADAFRRHRQREDELAGLDETTRAPRPLWPCPRPRRGHRRPPTTRPEAADLELTDDIDGAEQKAERRLARTLEELSVLFEEAAELASRGTTYFEHEWGAKRIAKSIVAELQETLSRLPISYQEIHPDVEWSLVRGMRNRVVHQYQDTDDEILWRVIVASIPQMKESLGLQLRSVLDELAFDKTVRHCDVAVHPIAAGPQAPDATSAGSQPRWHRHPVVWRTCPAWQRPTASSSTWTTGTMHPRTSTPSTATTRPKSPSTTEP